MKWAGLETPKCVTVHQRVNVTLGTSNKSSCLVIFTLEEMLIYKHTFPTSQEGTRALGTASNNNVNH